MNPLGEMAAVLRARAGELKDMADELDRLRYTLGGKEVGWHFTARRWDGDFEGSAWDTTVSARSEQEAWATLASLIRMFTMRLSDVSVKQLSR